MIRIVSQNDTAARNIFCQRRRSPILGRGAIHARPKGGSMNRDTVEDLVHRFVRLFDIIDNEALCVIAGLTAIAIGAINAITHLFIFLELKSKSSGKQRKNVYGQDK